jgi:hypothetical protein
MDLQTLIWVGMGLALYALPFAIGLSQPTLRAVVLLALASYCGLYASVWSALGVLFLPLVDLLIPQFELAVVVITSFLAGALQTALVSGLGFASRRWLVRPIRRWQAGRSCTPIVPQAR